MLIYLASSFACKEDYRSLKKLLEFNGHEITHDWSEDDVGDLEGEEKELYLMTCAGTSLMGVQAAEAMILLARPNMAGAFVEMGYALAASIPVVILDAFKEGNQKNVFYHLPSCEYFLHAGSVDEVLQLLAPEKPHDPYDKVVSIPGNN